jgi:uncharacterized membrane protein
VGEAGTDCTENLVKAELAIAFVLRYGVLVCGACLGLATALAIFGPSGGLGAHPSLTVSGLVAGLAALEPDAIASLGILLLILLPVLRVGMTVVLFLLERDYLYFAISTFVFVVLVFGLIYGKGL